MGSVGKWSLTSAGDGPFSASVFYMGETYVTPEGLTHELGHNFGLPHASSVSCVPESLIDPTDCGTWNEAGDSADTMGRTGGFQHFSSVFKSLCSWFDPSQVLDVTASGEYTLDQFEQPSSGVKTLRIPLGKDISGQETYYWVEYRTPGTFDQEQGVQVRFQSAAVYNGSSVTNNSLRFQGTAAGGSISGKVVREADGSGMAQVYVYLYDSKWKSLQYRLTDGAGRYVFKGLAAGSYYLRTYNSEGLTDEYYDNSPSPTAAVPVVVTQDQETANKDIGLAPGCVVSGAITRESDGVPIQNAYIYAYDASWSMVRSITTNSSGRFSLTGLSPGQYYLLARNSDGNYGYVSTYYVNAILRTSATPVLLSPGDRLKDIDFSMGVGGAISGQVRRESDGTPIQSVSVNAYDKTWNYVNSTNTGADGRYLIKSLPSGDYFVTTYNNQGYINEYYKEVTTRNAATAIQVVQESETGGIDFALAKPSTASATSRSRGFSRDWIGQAQEGDQNRLGPTTPAIPIGAATGRSDFGEWDIKSATPQRAGLQPGPLAIQSMDAMTPLSDPTSTEPFLDPYRGVKIELLETTGAGAEARARLRVTLSNLKIDTAHTVSFNQLPIGGTQVKEVRIVNESPTAVQIGKPGIQGRNNENFLVTWDECSGANLAPGTGCKVEVTFAPVRSSGTSQGEFAVLRIPTNDTLHSAASICLWGKVLASDLAVHGYPDSEFVAGQNGTYYLYVTNDGTVASSGTITITDKLPAGLRFVSNSSGWNCSVFGQDVSCSRLLSLPPNYSVSLYLTAAVKAEAAPQCLNMVTVAGSGDPNPDNNTAVIWTPVDRGPSTALYGPSLLSGDGMFTGVALYNAGTATAALSITALGKTGAPLQAVGAVNPATLVLKPGEQVPIMDDQLWGLPPGEKAKMSWFRVESVIEKVYGLASAFDGALQALEGASLSRSPAGTLILLDVETQDFTRIHVVNPRTTSVDLTISLVSAEGKVRAAVTRKLGPNASLAETVEALFGGVGVQASDYLLLASNGEILATECMGIEGRQIRAIEAQSADGGAQALYAAQYAVGGPVWISSISVVNLDSAPAQIRARLIDNDGNQIGRTVQMEVKGNGKVLLSDQNLFVDAGSELVQGYVEVSSDGARLIGSVAFGDKQGNVSAALPLQPAAHKEFVYGTVASNSTWYTGIALVNPNDSPINAILQLYDKTGKVSASKTEVIEPRRRKIKVLDQFFPEITGADISSGYIRISADNPLTGFALFGTTFGSVLSAIPPQVIR